MRQYWLEGSLGAQSKMTGAKHSIDIMNAEFHTAV